MAANRVRETSNDAEGSQAATKSKKRSNRRRRPRPPLIVSAAFIFLGLLVSSYLTLCVRVRRLFVPSSGEGSPPAAADGADAPLPAPRHPGLAGNNGAFVAEGAGSNDGASADARRPPRTREGAVGADDVATDAAARNGDGPPPPRKTTTATTTNWAALRYAGGGGGGGRFPARGTDEFARECGWTAVPPPGRGRGEGCVILARPWPGGHEGISEWVAMIARGYIKARQSGCRLMVDYGVGVDVRRVMEPLTDAAVGTGADEGLYNWSVPEGFECKMTNRCSLASSVHPRDAPRYRLALLYNHDLKEGDRCVKCLFDNSASALQRNLPGFKIESGFACSFANLFRPAQTAAEYEPRLFTEILPTLHDPEAFVVAIYIRTGQADETAKNEEQKKKGINVAEPVKEAEFKRMEPMATRMFNCAKEVEQSSLTGSTDALRRRKSYSKSVWIILTDSSNLKEWAVSAYTSSAVVPESYRRTVLVTGASGVHTRPQRNPSTADFAEALLDWYLIGESDAVIQSGPTFGTTASFRTARPSYDSRRCARPIMVHQRPLGPSNETKAKATVE